MDLKTIDITDPCGVQAVFDNLLDCQNKEDMAKLYDNIAPDYDMVSNEWAGPAETAAKLQEIEPNKNACILDVGCGTGLVGKAVSDVGYLNLYGIDMSESSLNIASEKGVYSKLINATFGPETPLNYKDGFFDVALSTGCFLPNHLDHTHLPEMIRLVKKGQNIIKPYMNLNLTLSNQALNSYPVAWGR
ncbi:methyltransferase-like protein 27 [Strongylocentrotus purpuratus]|uniref:Methyltransferase domain-containing protein n=1 Tax=Strongylocentrotus purpuratus TaxID=7668 RepID=A0A7M7T4R5_STRPU|nr:methyltransferase-like protein 27 [Strongylocentrotus purpuratus]